MLEKNPQTRNTIAGALMISVLAIVALFVWQGNRGFNLWDEGFLWYGAQRVLAGEVPIRDFMAYDPGRYYWSALLLSVLGNDGIMNLRLAVAIFQGLGLFVALWLVGYSTKGENRTRFLLMIMSTIIFALWMYPRHKLFDISLSIFVIAVLTCLIVKPTPMRHLLAGVGIGLIATFGRNHGIYGAFGSLCVLVWLHVGHGATPGCMKRIGLWIVGVVIGFSPILLMALFVPGFGNAFVESIRFLFEQKATNLPLPIPWPWTVHVTGIAPGEALRGIVVGLFFIAILLFAAVSIFWVVAQKLRHRDVPPVLVAATFVALPYSQFALSRADVGHLAQGIFPLLLGITVIACTVRGAIRWPVTVVLCAASFWVMVAFQPGFQCRDSEACVTISVSGSNLRTDANTARDVDLLRQLAHQYAANDKQTLISAPVWPGAYALLERRAAVWEIYPLFHRSDVFQNQEIARIKASRPGFAIIVDVPVDDRDELRYANTHALVYQYIVDHFDRIPYPANPTYQIYRAKQQ